MRRVLLLGSLAACTSGCLLVAAGAFPLGPSGGSPAQVGTVTPTQPKTPIRNPLPTDDDPPASPGSPPPISQPVVQPVAAEVGQSLLGTWGGTLQTGLYVELTFRDDHTVLLESLAGSSQGTFSLSGQIMTLAFPGESAIQHTVAFNGDKSQLQLGTQAYKRVR